MSSDFIADYLAYVKETEPPYIFHRWSLLASVGAILGRNFYLQFGHQRIFPNLYCFLIGDAGSRKSTAIKISAKLARGSGYENFAASKTRLEKFLLDLEGITEDDEGKDKNDYDAATAANLWSLDSFSEPREVFISADEFTDFAPRGDIDFFSLLGSLWDWDDEKSFFTHRLKNSKSVKIFQPTVSILGGITPEKFASTFPTEIIGGGFLSRIIIIHGERSGRKYTIPPVPMEEDTIKIISTLRSFKSTGQRAAVISPGAFTIFDRLYAGGGWREIDDTRFKTYSQRRFTQLLKLSLIIAACRGGIEITEEVAVTANTYLTAAETKMPVALGEFGKSRTSDVANKIMDLLNKSYRPMNAKDIWKHVHQDLEKLEHLHDIMKGLIVADKVQNVQEKGYLPKRKGTGKHEFVDWGLLTKEERDVL